MLHVEHRQAKQRYSLRCNQFTGEFNGLGQCFVDWATAVVDEADTCQLCVSFTSHSSGPNYETSAQSMEFSGKDLFQADATDL